jgi:hypothetical protein
MAALESQLIISADDRTAAAFASVQAKLAQLQSTIAAVDRVASPALANAGAFAGPGAALEEHAAAVKAGADQLRAATVPFSSATSSALDSLLKFAGIATGVEVAFEGIRQAFDQEHEKIRMQTAGMTPLEITDAEKLAVDTAKEYPSIRQSDALALERDQERHRLGFQPTLSRMSSAPRRPASIY